ncbi:hypothetical protein QR680_017331 [Steinernema hermaphroditum]|uniref:DUF1758 domain-containing protein n=1 Tax=Steinernema hermaphroditum TaxID=289476 RepID=A0AA39HEQ6_9BILA|nr:hypothetical protein QR680_017331 [Steinernema hermaphroditum]
MSTPTPPPAPRPTFAPLPTITVKKFKGDRREWAEFEAAFSLAVDSNTSLPAALKLTYLKGYLEGEASAVLVGLETTGANYTIAFDLLKKRFGDKSILKEQLHADLADLPFSSEKVVDLRRFVEKIATICRQLKDLGEDPNHPLTTQLIYKKLPTGVVSDLVTEGALSKSSQSWTTEMLQSKLIDIVERRETVYRHKLLAKQAGRKDDSSGRQPGKSHNSADQAGKQTATPVKETSAFPAASKPARKKSEPWCVFCDSQGDHWHANCPTHVTISQRRTRLKEMSRCEICFKNSHEQCRSRKTCFRCKEKGHNVALCPNKTHTACALTASSDNSSKMESVDHTNTVETFMAHRSEDVLQTAPVTLFNPDAPELNLECHAFLDSGSQRSYTLPSVASQLRLSTHSKTQLSVRGLGDSTLNFASKEVQIGIRLRDGSSKIFAANTCPTITANGLLSTSVPVGREESAAETVKPSILLGNKIFWEICASNITTTLPNGFTLVKSKLGDIVTGRGILETSESYPVQCETTTMIATEYYEHLWKLETIGITDDPCVKDDKVAEKILKDNIKWTGDCYEVALLWKDAEPDLPDNLGVCRQRLVGLYNRLKHSPEDLEGYDNYVKELHDLGFIEKVTTNSDSDTLCHYLPHRDVFKEVGGIRRVVFDASSKAKKSLNSLNDLLYRGPNKLPDIAGILLRSRVPPIVTWSDLQGNIPKCPTS